MKFTICDDTASDLENLESIINAYCKLNNCSITLEKHNNPDSLIRKVIFNPSDYQVFFLDIVMQSNGIELASKIRKYREDAIIIFTTSSREFALDAFTVQAQDYILKPLNSQYVFRCIDRIFEQLNTTPQTVCKIKTDDYSIVTINIKDIAYIESINRRLVIYLKTGEKITSTTLHSKFLDSIPFDFIKCNFINCHASYVVNMNFIKSISDKYFVMKNDDTVPISKSLLPQVKKTYVRYVVGD